MATTTPGRNNLDTTTPGQCVIVKAIPGAGIAMTATGNDAGTGDVTIKIDPAVDHAFTALQSMTIADAQTNGVAAPLQVGHNTSGTVAASFGTGINFVAECNAVNNVQMGRLDYIWTTVGASPSAALRIGIVSAGTNAGRVWIYDTGGITQNVGDPGAGIINAGTGFKIGNVGATAGKILIGDGTNFVASTPTWPTTAGVAGSAVVSDGTNLITTALPVAVLTAAVDQTAVTETAHLTYTVPGGSPVVGTTYKIYAWGNMDNGTTAITFTPKIRFGGIAGTVLLTGPLVVSSTTLRTNQSWLIEAAITFRAVGASPTVVAQMAVDNHTASATGVFARDENDSGATAVASVGTLAARDLLLTWAISVTTGTPHVRTLGGYIELVR